MIEKTRPRLAVITGFSSGLGFATARGLAAKGWRVLGITRSPTQGQRAVEILRAQTGNPSVSYQAADLSLVQETRDVAALIAAHYPSVDVLVNNVGALFHTREETAEGVERTFALNYLCPFVLTQSLLPILRGRIVTVSSEAHRGATLSLDDLEMQKKYNGWTQYQRTKLMNILFTRELTQRLPDTLTTLCLHPGLMQTAFGKGGALPTRLARKLILLSALKPATAAQSILRLIIDETLKEANGTYFDRGHAVSPSKIAQDEALALQLWEKTEALLR